LNLIGNVWVSTPLPVSDDCMHSRLARRTPEIFVYVVVVHFILVVDRPAGTLLAHLFHQELKNRAYNFSKQVGRAVASSCCSVHPCLLHCHEKYEAQKLGREPHARCFAPNAPPQRQVSELLLPTVRVILIGASVRCVWAAVTCSATDEWATEWTPEEPFIAWYPHVIAPDIVVVEGAKRLCRITRCLRQLPARHEDLLYRCPYSSADLTVCWTSNRHIWQLIVSWQVSLRTICDQHHDVLELVPKVVVLKYHLCISSGVVVVMGASRWLIVPYKRPVLGRRPQRGTVAHPFTIIKILF
jgi:hypothetical protein